MKMKSHRLAAALAGTALAVASLASRAQDITVGVILATTGPGSAVGIPARNALALWPAEIAGHKLKPILQDDRSDPSSATAIARRMASDDRVDLIVGGSLTPSSLALTAVAGETEVPFLTLSPTVLTEKNSAWSFNLPPLTDLMSSAIFEHMDQARVKSVGFIGFSDVWGDQWLGELKKYAARTGVKITAEERYGRADTSVSGQVLRLIASRPDVILVGGTSSAAGLVQKALVDNNFKGQIYHTHGAATRDFLRIAGKDGEGAIAPAGPSTVAEDLPDNNLTKAPGVAFTRAYEEKNGPATRTPFAAHMYDSSLVMQKAIPVALKTAQPGSKEFRAALKQALESVRDLPASQGVFNYSAMNHNGLDQRSRVLVVVKDGAWKYLRP
jgi:branched-chain amino acid transport system substrate-binding protein